MAGRTSLVADIALNLYRGTTAAGFSQTWIGLFTTAPTQDTPTGHGGVEWGPARKRIFPNSGAGAPYWSAPFDLDTATRQIQNTGSITWLTVALTASPSTVQWFGVFSAQTGGNLLTWGSLDSALVVTDGQSITFGTGTVFVRSY